MDAYKTINFPAKNHTTTKTDVPHAGASVPLVLQTLKGTSKMLAPAKLKNRHPNVCFLLKYSITPKTHYVEPLIHYDRSVIHFVGALIHYDEALKHYEGSLIHSVEPVIHSVTSVIHSVKPLIHSVEADASILL